MTCYSRASYVNLTDQMEKEHSFYMVNQGQMRVEVEIISTKQKHLVSVWCSRTFLEADSHFHHAFLRLALKSLSFLLAA